MGHHHNHHRHSHEGPHSHGEHGHNCPSQSANAPRLLWAAALTGSFMVVEAIGGIVSGSLALLADAGHMVTDFAALIAAYIGVSLEEKRAPDQPPSRAPTWIAFFSAASLLFIAAWIVFEAISRLNNPSEILSGPMLIIAIIGLLMNMVVFYILSKGNRDSLNMRGAILHVATDMLGSAAAIIAALVIMTTGYFAIDPILSLIVAALISISALPLLSDSVKALRV